MSCCVVLWNLLRGLGLVWLHEALTWDDESWYSCGVVLCSDETG